MVGGAHPTKMANDHQILRLGLCQHACVADPLENLRRATDLIRQAAQAGCHLAVTQELFTTLYFPQVESADHFALAEPIPGPTTDHLCALAGELGIEIAASLFEKRAPGVYHNTSVMIDHRGKLAGRYRKMHIPDDPGFFEKYYFTPGDGPPAAPGWRTYQTRKATVGTLICWDQWYPEAARLTALQGAQVLLYPTAIGFIPEDPPGIREAQRDAWITMQRSHAIANGLFVAAVNRIGVEGDLQFYGSSFVADPAGVIIAQAGREEEALLVVDCDLSRIEPQRQAWPFLRDRRIDAYADLTRRFIDPATGPDA